MGNSSKGVTGVTRKVTCKILEAIEDGLLDSDAVIRSCLCYMSEQQVAEMAEMNEFFPDYEE